MTINMLVTQKEQVFDSLWQQRMNVSITDTGNALSDNGIMELSRQIHVDELICCRNEVAKQTREIVAGLNFQDLRWKVLAADLERILSVGGVTEQEESLWLLDFWGKKDVAGILLMPPLRHVILHLNDCCKWKEAVRTKKRFYRGK